MENWRPVVGHEDSYEVSDLGRVRSLARVVTVQMRSGRAVPRPLAARILQPQMHSGGYLKFTLWRRGIEHQIFGHKLVLTAFVGPRPAGHQACHRDGVRRNNALSNLRWDTPSSNQGDRERHGTGRVGRPWRGFRVDNATVWKIRLLSPTLTKTEIAKLLGMPRTTVADIVNGRTRKGAI